MSYDYVETPTKSLKLKREVNSFPRARIRNIYVFFFKFIYFRDSVRIPEKLHQFLTQCTFRNFSCRSNTMTEDKKTRHESRSNSKT